MKSNVDISIKNDRQMQNVKPNSQPESPKNKTERLNAAKPNKRKSIKFAVPLTILIIEPKSKYCGTVWCGIGIGIVHIIIGATNMTVVLYSLQTGDYHALISCLAFHFFSAEAILSLNYTNGWSTPMRLRHRRLAHVCLQFCALTIALVGIVFTIVNRGVPSDVHSISGSIAVVLAVLSAITGNFALVGRNKCKIIHMSCGIVTFLVATISLCTGILNPQFSTWARHIITYTLISLITFYSIFIIITCTIKCFLRI